MAEESTLKPLPPEPDASVEPDAAVEPVNPDTSVEPDAPESPDAAFNEELLALLGQRTSTYMLLSRLYLKEFDRGLLDEMHAMVYPLATGDDDVDTGYLYIATFLSNLWDESLTELAVDYARCFLGNGVDAFSAAYPFESVYTSEKRLLMQEARDEVLAIYRSFGIEKQDGWNEGEDHIALELEFMRVLNERTVKALEAGDDGEAAHLLLCQRNFLQHHLVSWAPMMTADLRRFAKTKLYQGLAYLTDGFLRTDLALLQDLLSDSEVENGPGPEPRPAPEAEPEADARPQTPFGENE